MLWHSKLFWAATLMLQCRCSTQANGQLVSLQCSEDVAAPAINCTIEAEKNCTGYQYMWRHSESKNGNICLRGDSNYKCAWDNRTFVSLVFTMGVKCETYQVFIDTSCGIAKSDISVTHCRKGELFLFFGTYL